MQFFSAEVLEPLNKGKRPKRKIKSILNEIDNKYHETCNGGYVYVSAVQGIQQFIKSLFQGEIGSPIPIDELICFQNVKEMLENLAEYNKYISAELDKTEHVVDLEKQQVKNRNICRDILIIDNYSE
jgi:hypothetical protein